MKRLAICTLVLTGCVQEQITTSGLEQEVYESNVLSKTDVHNAYYWYGNKKITLTELPTKKTIILRNNPNLLQSQYPSDINQTLFQNNKSLAIVEDTIVSNYADNIEYIAPCYMLTNGTTIGVSNIFHIRLKSETDYSKLQIFAERYNAQIISDNYIPLWYTIQCDSDCLYNALELSNIAHECGEFAATDVEFVNSIKPAYTTFNYNDPLFSTQWNLNDTYGLQISDVHTISTGDPRITVAVIDMGFQINHPDLDITDSWDATTQTVTAKYYPYEEDAAKNHGTNMAGIIGAEICNAIGIVGIAPSVNILPISVNFNGHNVAMGIANAIRYATDYGADIISNSWYSNAQHTVFEDAINYSFSMGRDGSGCIFVQCSGNESTSSPMFPYGAMPDIISVGNMQSNGVICPTSCYGTHLDLVAPGHAIPSLGINNSYTECNGTSPACPHVAATAALMLSVNPHLTRQDVSNILETTAIKLPAYIFNTLPNKPNGTWNNKAGYGLVNCKDAVIKAKNYFTDTYTPLISFDYVGSFLDLSLSTNKNIAIIWDSATNDISFTNGTNGIYSNERFTHTYVSCNKHHIIIAEQQNTTDYTQHTSYTIKDFTLESGNKANNIIIDSTNVALQNIKIIGGSEFTTQNLQLCNLPSLSTIHLKCVKNLGLIINSCPALTELRTSDYIWYPPSITDTYSEEDMSPFIIIGGDTSNMWPNKPEDIVSLRAIDIRNCPNLKRLSLENVGITTINLNEFPKLYYIYISSQENKIVGGGSNSSNLSSLGQYLVTMVHNLPARVPIDHGTLIIKCINNDNSGYIPVSLYPINYHSILSTASTRYWDINWHSGVSTNI